MLFRERVEAVLTRIRPVMQADGGDIELVEVHGRTARVRLTGACAGCPSSTATLKMGIESRLRELIPEVSEVVSV